MIIKDIKRLGPAGQPRLHSAGWLPSHTVDVSLVSYNLNFSVQRALEPWEGRSFTANGMRRPVSFPRVQVWIPGGRYECKYDGLIESLYFGYDSGSLPWADAMMRASGLKISEEFFGVNVTPAISGLIQSMRGLIEDVHAPGNVDRLDLTAGMLLLECLLNRRQTSCADSAGAVTDRKIRDIASKINSSYLDFDLDSELRRHGLGRRAFFRRWGRFFSVTPHQYLLQRRLHQAELLLEYSGLSVKDIAEKTGFSDSFHLSKLFRRRYGVCPSAFRAGRGR
jgi:AraC-like DNA-binding protein